MHVGIVGASGAVGQTIVSLLSSRNFPVTTLRLFGSKRSEGKTIVFQGQTIALQMLEEKSLQDLDLIFFCAGSDVSKEWIPICLKGNAFVIDSSSFFRKDPLVPLLIPEINGSLLSSTHRLVSSPNCAATVLALPLFPLHRALQAKRVIVSTYHAASGAGATVLKKLQEETKAHLENVAYPPFLPFPYAFNLFPHNSPLEENGYVGEEIKIRDETKRILGDNTIALSATCVRVPVLRAHSLSVNVSFTKPFTLEQVYELLSKAKGVKIFEDRKENRFATPFDATGKDEIYCGRFRYDFTAENTLEFWAVGDQLLKGAALNAIQIAERKVLLSKRAPLSSRDGQNTSANCGDECTQTL